MKSGGTRKLGRAWVDEMESEVEGLRDLRADLRRRLNEADLEARAVWEDQERRWRRLETKLRKLAERTSEGVHPGLATNIENLLESLDEAYQELDGLLD